MSRKLDAAIAGALGYRVSMDGREEPISPEIYSVEKFDGGGYRWYDLPTYSTNGNAMLELDREMRERGYSLYVEYAEKEYCVEYFLNGIESKLEGYAETLPMAFALAAYKALTGMEWEGE